jgi:tetratricopeptide (TPR) repeat protein
MAHEDIEEARRLALYERYEEAEALLARLVASAPTVLEPHLLLARVRHILGDPDFARSLRDASRIEGAPASLRVAHADVMRRSGHLPLAEELLREAASTHPERLDARSALSLVLLETGRAAEAVSLARTCLDALPRSANAAENLVAALLSAGEAREALPIVERFRQQHPDDLRWITYRADVARHIGEDHYDLFCDLERLVRVYELEPPAGYDSIEHFHSILVPFVASRHRHEAHPLDQTLRGGTEASMGLVGDSSEIVQAFFGAIAAPIAAYQAEIGYDVSHPLRSRNVAPAHLVGCWSVRLRRGGHHVNHTHPRGWISSAYYLSVPREVDDDARQSGWLKLGEPLYPMPAAKAGRFIKPRPGLLVLFPSYVWHGTTPIVGDEPRTTMAFDAVP